jgi:flagellar protein FlaJ
MFLPNIPIVSSTEGSGMLSIIPHTAEYNLLFMHASVIQGFFSGIIVGQMMGESVFDGLKHSLIMMTIACLFFVWFM